LKLVDHPHSSKWWMYVKKWERMKSDDEYCESWVDGGTRCIIRRQDHGRNYCIMRRWATQVCMVEIEVEESLVGDGSWSRVILVSVSIQRRRKEKVHRPCVRLGKWSRIGKWGGERRGWFEKKIKGLFSCVKKMEVGKGGFVLKSLSR